MYSIFKHLFYFYFLSIYKCTSFNYFNIDHTLYESVSSSFYPGFFRHTFHLRPHIIIKTSSRIFLCTFSSAFSSWYAFFLRSFFTGAENGLSKKSAIWAPVHRKSCLTNWCSRLDFSPAHSRILSHPILIRGSALREAVGGQTAGTRPCIYPRSLAQRNNFRA